MKENKNFQDDCLRLKVILWPCLVGYFSYENLIFPDLNDLIYKIKVLF